MAPVATPLAGKRPQAPLPVHPFPARMAPELALERLPDDRAHVLDQMMGSGTIPVLAGVEGHVATGFDLDPLALLIAQTWGRPLDGERYLAAAEAVAKEAAAAGAADVAIEDVETRAFVDRWFDVVAQGRLAAFSAVRGGMVLLWPGRLDVEQFEDALLGVGEVV